VAHGRGLRLRGTVAYEFRMQIRPHFAGKVNALKHMLALCSILRQGSSPLRLLDKLCLAGQLKLLW